MSNDIRKDKWVAGEYLLVDDGDGDIAGLFIVDQSFSVSQCLRDKQRDFGRDSLIEMLVDRECLKELDYGFISSAEEGVASWD